MEGMNRRNALIALAVGGGAAAVGCEGTGRNERFTEEVSKSAIEIRKAFAELETDVAGFETRDWRDVVEDVKAAMAELAEKIRGFEEWVNTPVPSD
jgi:hypothetical protein